MSKHTKMRALAGAAILATVMALVWLALPVQLNEPPADAIVYVRNNELYPGPAVLMADIKNYQAMRYADAVATNTVANGVDVRVRSAGPRFMYYFEKISNDPSSRVTLKWAGYDEVLGYRSN